MTDADIHSGDIVVVDKSNRISPEDDFKVWGTVTYIIHKPRE